MAASMRTWIAGTAGLCVVVLALGGFVLVKPQLDQRTTLREETADLAAANDLLAQEVEQLKADYADIETYRAALAAGQVKIPQQADLAAMLREISSTAEATGVALITASPQTAEATTTEEDGEPAPAESGESDDSAEPTAEPSPSAGSADAQQAAQEDATEQITAALSEVEGLYAIPVTIDVAGNFAAIQSFLATLQTGTQRYFFAGPFTMSRIETAGGKLPDTVQPGDVELAVQAFVYTLTPVDGSVPEAEDQGGDTTVPAVPGADPFTANPLG
ncbi:hypothetical protein [Cellulomonas sp. NPDC089187]|uniref:hypothetical protein n=1 Tax=Cellulomonas sp. NPDC089187 TaxID=3154970 RepID=UPI0034464AB8